MEAQLSSEQRELEDAWEQATSHDGRLWDLLLKSTGVGTALTLGVFGFSEFIRTSTWLASLVVIAAISQVVAVGWILRSLAMASKLYHELASLAADAKSNRDKIETKKAEIANAANSSNVFTIGLVYFGFGAIILAGIFGIVILGINNNRSNENEGEFFLYEQKGSHRTLRHETRGASSMSNSDDNENKSSGGSQGNTERKPVQPPSETTKRSRPDRQLDESVAPGSAPERKWVSGPKPTPRSGNEESNEGDGTESGTGEASGSGDTGSNGN